MRKPGWYWVKWDDSDPWQCAQWDNGGWWMSGDDMHIGNELVVGPRIPTPDEPWQCVTLEPTAEMIEAAREQHEGDAYLPVSLYRAMLAAAPKPESQP